MSRSARWKEFDINNGVLEVEFTSWKYFYDHVRQEMLNFSHYVWRGQRGSKWKLESSLHRSLKNKLMLATKTRRHLDRFRQATRGRRGTNPIQLHDDNEWWALGQHHGLATPLLDWTQSPFAALYFAFEKPTRPASGMRTVWALGDVEKKNAEISATHKAQTPVPTSNPAILQLVRPAQDENARLVAQSGLFTLAPIGESVDDWVRKHYMAESQYATLIKLLIPELGRTECLRTLNTMNINHLSLFPDLYGASLHCNKALEIDRY